VRRAIAALRSCRHAIGRDATLERRRTGTAAIAVAVVATLERIRLERAGTTGDAKEEQE
jgi:hypothetical protein